MYGPLLQSIVGITFLGTPHRGSQVASLGTIVANIVDICSKVSTAGLQSGFVGNDLLKQLKYDATPLDDLADDFKNCFDGMAIVSFYETQTLLSQRVRAIYGFPRQASSNFPNFPYLRSSKKRPRNWAFHMRKSDHSTPITEIFAGSRARPMTARPCARPCGESPLSRRVVDTSLVAQARLSLRDVSGEYVVWPRVRSADHGTAFNERELSCMKLFNPFDMADYRRRLPIPIEGTCQWILKHPLFMSWFEGFGNALLWLTGHPACGKTMISYSLARQVEASQKNVLFFSVMTRRTPKSS